MIVQPVAPKIHEGSEYSEIASGSGTANLQEKKLVGLV